MLDFERAMVGTDRSMAVPATADTAVRAGPVEAIGPDGWLVATFLAIGALLRFATIAHQSFWVDEASTVHEVGLSFGGMLSSVAHNEATPPVYFAVAWVWTRIFGDSELGIRSLSALCGTGLILVTYLCGRELASRTAGVIAAALTAVSPFMIWYSQEARAYMLLALLSGLSVLFLARAIDAGPADRRHVVWWAVVSALALGTHFFAGLLILPEAVWLVYRSRSQTVVAAVAAVIVVQLALLPLASTDLSHNLDLWIGGLPFHARLAGIPATFSVSQLYVTATAQRWGLPGAAILAGLVAVLVWRGSTVERRGAVLLALLATVVILVPILAAELGQDDVFARNFTPAWVPLVILVSIACSAGGTRPLGFGLALVLMAGFGWATFRIQTDAAYQKPDWRGVAAALGTATGPRQIALYGGNAWEEPMSLYLRGTHFSWSGYPPSNAAVPVSEIDVIGTLAPTVPRSLPRGVRLLSLRYVDGYQVARFVLEPRRRLQPSATAALAPRLLGPGSGGTAAVLVQP